MISRQKDEAVAFVEKHVSKNQALNNSLEQFPPCKDEDDPLLNRYYYVHDQGKRRIMAGTGSKKLEGNVSGKQLTDLAKDGAFIELVGDKDTSQASGSADTTAVKDEHPELAAARQSAETLRKYFSSCFVLCKAQMSKSFVS